MLKNRLIFMWLLHVHFEFFWVLAFAKDISLAQKLFQAIVLNSKYNLFLTSTYQCLKKILFL